jgi:hypothetical protein
MLSLRYEKYGYNPKPVAFGLFWLLIISFLILIFRIYDPKKRLRYAHHISQQLALLMPKIRDFKMDVQISESLIDPDVVSELRT